MHGDRLTPHSNYAKALDLAEHGMDRDIPLAQIYVGLAIVDELCHIAIMLGHDTSTSRAA